jgi:TonB-linked SusC/RagA family outer membrane protein
MYRFYTRLTVSFSDVIAKTMLIMRLATLLLITTIMQVSASSSAQTITLREKNAPFDSVLEKVRRQSGLNILFTDASLKNANAVTINVRDMDIKLVLEELFDKQPFDYSMRENSLVISKKEKSFLDNLKGIFTDIRINGQVLDENGKQMPGVVVKIKTIEKNTVVSRSDGTFSLVAPDDAVLVFSFVGYATKEMPAAPKLIVKMQPTTNQLEETVVVGYGSTKRKDLTGSVASVNVEELRNIPFTSVDQALTGKAAGVQVVQADGAPGGVAKIRIRGGTSLLGGNDPLYIIDGVQLQVQNNYLGSAADIVSPVERAGNDDPNNTVSGSFSRSLNSLGGLNINDIETLDILKDASATAIYGSRAANGVVIITTKKGVYNQRSSIDANYYTGISVAQKQKVLDRDQYIMILKEGATNLNAARALKNLAADPTANQILTNPSFFEGANTDWMDLVLRKGITQNADVSVRGGGAGSRYYTSFAYNKNNGVVEGSDFTRVAGKISLDNDISPRFRVSTNLDYAFTSNNISNGVYTQAMYAPPTMSPYNADGSIRVIDPSSLGAYAYQGFQNPLFLLKGVNQANTVSLIGSIAAEYDILKSLKFRSSVSVNFQTYNQRDFVPSSVSVATDDGAGSSGNGIATQGQSQRVNTFYENTLTWTKEFDANNRLTILGGTSWNINKSKSFTASGQGFPDDTYLNNLSSAAITLPSTGISGQNSLLSFYARANYTFLEKYIFTFTGRSDESSKFPKNNRVGYFPSGGVAWRISSEKFLKNVTWIDEIKLRASAGYTGTQNIGDNLFYTLYSPVSYAGMNGLAPSQLGNNTIKWESTLQKDAGIDFSFFKSRIRGEFGYYQKETSGVLFPYNVATSSGFSSVTANIANIRNRGLELAISGDFIRKSNFQWSGALNISGNRSKVLSLPVNPDNSDQSVYHYGNTILKVGEPVGLLYGRVFDGIIQNQAELDAYKKASYFGSFLLPYTGIGDARYQGDGIEIAPGYTQQFYKDDIVGQAEPTFYGGYTNNINYHQFSLSILSTFSKGGDIYYLADAQNDNLSSRTNKGVRILDRWTPENTQATRPRLLLGQSSYAYVNSANVYDASFFKIKSVTLNFSVPQAYLKRIKLTKANFYVSATNLLTITSYPGADPEVSNDPYSLIGGYSDAGGYPTVRQFSVGLRLGL